QRRPPDGRAAWRPCVSFARWHARDCFSVRAAVTTGRARLGPPAVPRPVLRIAAMRQPAAAVRVVPMARVAAGTARVVQAVVRLRMVARGATPQPESTP